MENSIKPCKQVVRQHYLLVKLDYCFLLQLQRSNYHHFSLPFLLVLIMLEQEMFCVGVQLHTEWYYLVNIVSNSHEIEHSPLVLLHVLAALLAVQSHFERNHP